MKLTKLNPKQSINKAYLKEKVHRFEIEKFKNNLSKMLEDINEQESEEHVKNILTDFLKDTFYKDKHFINTKDRKDLVIHNDKTAQSSVGVLMK